MIKVTLEDGFKCTINENALDDMNFIRMLGKVDKEPFLFDEITARLIGEDGLDKLYKHLETEDGRVPIKAFSDAVNEIIVKGGEQLKK